MQDTTMANILNEAKMVKKNDAKFNYDMKKTIIISLQLDAKIKPFSKEVTVMVMTKKI